MELLPEQLLGYVLLFAALAAIFRVWYAPPVLALAGMAADASALSLIIVGGNGHRASWSRSAAA